MEAQPGSVATPLSAAPAPGRVAGFWVRVLSDFIDGLVLWSFGALLAIPLRGVFERLGERGVFIGLAVSLAYSGVLQSRIGRGQTLGKRLLGLRVTKLDGSFLSLDRSLVRYMLVSFAIYQTAVAYALVTVLPFLRLDWIVAPSSGLALAVGLGCFFVIPFHPLKRGLHDLLAGSIVTRGGPLDPAFVASRDDARRDRRIVIGGLVVALLASVGGLAVSAHFRDTVRAPATFAAASDLEMHNVSLTNTRFASFGGKQNRVLMIAGFLPRPSGGAAPDWNEAAKRLTAAAHADFKDAPIDRVGVALRSGYNIGIAKSYDNDVRWLDWRTGQVTSIMGSKELQF
ncbi:MAG TPA: RDD family protein [Polyangia bacterium]|nr:RDD family protein [Polyangia bacterium]